MNALSLAGILGGLSSFGFGLFVYLQNPRRPLYRKWFRFALCVGVWGIGAFAVATLQDPALSYLAWRLVFGISIIWMPPFFIDFVADFCERELVWLIRAAYSSALLFSVTAIATPFFFSGVRRVFGEFYYAVPDFRLFSLFLIWWVVLLVYTHYLLVKAYPAAPEPKKRQIWYFFAATAIGFGGGSLTFLPLLHIDLYPWGDLCVPIYPVIMSYATVEYQLLDINLLARRALISSVTIALIAFGLVLGGFSSSWINQHFGIPPVAVALVGAIIAFILGRLFWQRTAAADRLRYEFVEVAAHKLRTPLSEIRWSASALSQTASLEESHELAASIMSSSARLLELINSLLRSAQTEDDFYAYKFAPCDIRALAERVVAEHAISLKQKGLQVSLDSALDQPLAIADEARLAEVIQILLENAILYTPAGGSIGIAIASYSKDFIILRIHDTGIGIDKKDLGQLFRRFYRGGNALKVSTEGSGLGLFMAKEILRRHGGLIGADSEGPGKGGTFWFIVPRAR